MTKNLLFVCGLSLLLLSAGAARADAQTVAAGPYYAVPSWDQKLLCDTPATCPRFVVLSNWSSEAVLDRETGLVWKQSPFTIQAPQAVQEGFCKSDDTGGRYGWRLPTRVELVTLGSPTAVGPTFHLPAGHPFNVNVADGTSFWTSDLGASVDFSPNFAGVVHFPVQPTDHLRGWCVRGIQ